MGTSLPEMFFFDARERELVELVLRAVGEGGQAASLERGLEWLGRVAGLVLDCPALTQPDHEQESAAVDGLIDHLCAAPDYDFCLSIPTKAVLGQAYLVAKINFIKAMETAVEDANGNATPELRARLHFELGQSIYSRLAEEVFIALVTDPETPREIKGSVGRFLFQIWDQRLLTEIDDFAPALEAAWEARNKVKPVLGTMLGSHEVFRLFQEARDGQFLDYYCGEGVSEEQAEAFEEFLFGLAHEEIVRLREHLVAYHRSAVSPEEAARILGWNGLDDRRRAEGPEALYASYKRRKVKAGYRAMTGAHGPKHTAEEYVMLWFLQHPHDDPDGS